MGGFSVKTQTFSVYQAIDWICNQNASSNDRINGVRRIRQMVEKNQSDDVIRLGIPSHLVELLGVSSDHFLQSEIVWTLANLAAGTKHHTGVVLRKGLQIFLKLLDDDSCPPEIKSDVVWALSNISGDCAEYRDKLLSSGVMKITLTLLDKPLTYELEKNCVWLISNLCRHKNPLPDFTLVSTCIPYLARYLKHEIPEIIGNACWALKYLADGPWYQIEELISAGICQQLVEIITTGCSSNIVGVLLVCINISSGTSDQTQVLLDCGIIPLLSKLLDTSQNNHVLKNAAFLISNIAADSKSKIQSLIDEQIFEKFAKIFKDCDNATQLEILNAVNNASHNGENEQIMHLESSGCGEEVLRYGLTLDSEAVKISLDAIWNIALAQARESRAVTSITKFDSSIKKLQHHQDEQIAYLANSLAYLL